MLNNKKSAAGTDVAQRDTESVLCKKTLEVLKELGAHMGASFFPQLLETFEHDAVGHLAVLRSAIAAGESSRVRGEAHALKGASLTIGAQGMAQICQQLEDLGTAQCWQGALKELARLDHEFARVKTKMEQESLIP